MGVEEGRGVIRMPRPVGDESGMPEFFGRTDYMPLGETRLGTDNDNRTTIILDMAFKVRRKRGGFYVLVPIETYGGDADESDHVVVLTGQGRHWDAALEGLEDRTNPRSQ